MADVPEYVDSYTKALKPSDREAILLVVDDLEDAKKQHDAFSAKVEQWYRGYRGVLEKQSEAAQWTSKNHPPFAFSLIETVVANMIDDRTVFNFHPRPLIDDLDTIESYVTGAKALENLVRYELQMDRFDRKQRPIALQASIAGISPVKVLWDYQEGVGRRYVTKSRDITHPDTGEVIASYPVLVEEEHTRIVRDGPSVGPIDVRDFFWPDNADDIQSARYIIHRVWMSIDELRALEAQGVYQNVDDLSESRDMMDYERAMWRSDELFLTNRKRKMVEVLERWGADGRVTTVGNRKVLLRDFIPERDNDGKQMFWHGKKPFAIVSSMPQPFQMVGVSDMEAIWHLQNALWTSINQTADNVALLNNAIFIISDTVDDEEMEFAPGEFWQFENPATDFTQWQPNALPAELATGFQDRLQAFMNEITGGLGMMSNPQQADANTATGVSTFMSIAQRRLQARRAQFAYAYQDIADMVVSDLQQFMDKDRLAPIIGRDGAMAFERVSPMQIQGRYVADVEAISESLMRQEKRAEAQALLTLALQGAPLASAMGSPLNLHQWYYDLLEAFDKVDCERYFAAGQAAGLVSQGAEPPTGGGGSGYGAPSVPPAQPGQVGLKPMPLGVTAPTAAGITSPSNQVSQSPMMMLQRAVALRGGGRNV